MSAEWLLTIACTLQVWLLVRCEARAYGSAITPIAVLGIPFVAVIWLAKLFAPAMGFMPVQSSVLIIWCAGLQLFWTCGWLARRALPNHMHSLVAPPAHEDMSRADVIAIWLGVLVLAINLVKLRTLLGGAGFAAVASSSFQEAFSVGIAAHARAAGLVLTVYFIGTARVRPVLKWTLTGCLAILGLLYQVKYLVLVPLAGGFLLSALLAQQRMSLKKVAGAIALAVAAFGAVYLIGFAAAGSASPFTRDVFAFLGRHFATYLFSGVLAAGSAMASNHANLAADPGVVVLSLSNLIEAVLGGSRLQTLEEATKYWVVIANDGNETNVFTFFGVLYLYLGAAGAAVYTVVCASVVYVFHSLALWSRNVWMLSGSCLLLGFLAFGWFHFFFWLLSPIEALGIACIVAIYCRHWIGSGLRTSDPLPIRGARHIEGSLVVNRSSNPPG